ncbi:MAG: acetoacetate decarboxylase family protein [Rudanella sp.]|nr:acetoacetate decarboxylase family protein [Rudanella sp.]
MQPEIKIVPAPWTLHGDGVVMIVHFSEAFVRRHGFLADFQRDGYRGYVGTVMLVDYHTSGVGPYRELLFIPGVFKLGGQTTFSISKIYVSSSDSVWNGIENWGIPKELADFNITTLPNGTRVFEVSRAGRPFFSARVKPWSFRFPVSTSLLPAFQVMQQNRGNLLLTKPEATGKGRLASLSQVVIDPVYFPDLRQGIILSTIAVQDFTMTFPVPTYV